MIESKCARFANNLLHVCYWIDGSRQNVTCTIFLSIYISIPH